MEALHPLETWLGRSKGADALLRLPGNSSEREILQQAAKAWAAVKSFSKDCAASVLPGQGLSGAGPPLHLAEEVVAQLSFLSKHRLFLYVAQSDARALLAIVSASKKQQGVRGGGPRGGGENARSEGRRIKHEGGGASPVVGEASGSNEPAGHQVAESRVAGGGGEAAAAAGGGGGRAGVVGEGAVREGDEEGEGEQQQRRRRWTSVVRCCLLLLTAWIRRASSLHQPAGGAVGALGGAAPFQQVSALAAAAVEAVCHACCLVEAADEQAFASSSDSGSGSGPEEAAHALAVLFLGAASSASACSRESQQRAGEGVLALLRDGSRPHMRAELPEVLAGAGYAMSALHTRQLAGLLSELLSLLASGGWRRPHEEAERKHELARGTGTGTGGTGFLGLEVGGGAWEGASAFDSPTQPPSSPSPPAPPPAPLPFLEEGLLLLRLMEYEGTRLRAYVGPNSPAGARAQALADLDTVGAVLRGSAAPGTLSSTPGGSSGKTAPGEVPAAPPLYSSSKARSSAAALAIAGLLRGLCRGLDRSMPLGAPAGAPGVSQAVGGTGGGSGTPEWEGAVGALESALLAAAVLSCPWRLPPTLGAGKAQADGPLGVVPELRADIPGASRAPLAPWLPPALSWAGAADLAYFDELAAGRGPANLPDGMPALPYEARREEARAALEARHWHRCTAVAVCRLYSGGGAGAPPQTAVAWSLAAALFGDCLQAGPFHIAALHAERDSRAQSPSLQPPPSHTPRSTLAPRHPLPSQPPLPSPPYSAPSSAPSLGAHSPPVPSHVNGAQRAALPASGVWDFVQTRLGFGVGAGGLEAHTGSAFFREAGGLARGLCEQLKRAPLDARLAATGAVAHFARSLFRGQQLLTLVQGGPLAASPPPASGPEVAGRQVAGRGGEGSKSSSDPSPLPLTWLQGLATLLQSGFLSSFMVLTTVVPKESDLAATMTTADQGRQVAATPVATSGSREPARATGGLAQGQMRERGQALRHRTVTPGALGVDAVEALACLDFCRVQVTEYGELVARAVGLVSPDARLVRHLAARLPPYEEVAAGPGGGPWLPAGASYSWWGDHVQVARTHFLLRVLPPCLGRLPPPLFAARVASSMFLYQLHPDRQVASAAHALFAAFLATEATPSPHVHVRSRGRRRGDQSRKDAHPDELAGGYDVEREEDEEEAEEEGGEQEAWDEDGLASMKEQMAVFYAEQALQAYPGVTPFEAFVQATGGIVRCLPPGSPATALCLQRLSERVQRLHALELLALAEEERGYSGPALEVGGRGSPAHSPAVPSSPAGQLPPLQGAGVRAQPRGEPPASSPGVTGGGGAKRAAPGRQQRQQQPQQRQGEKEEEEEEVDGAERLQLVLFHLIPIVDLQVLPVLLREVASVVLALPYSRQRHALTDLFDVLAHNDDYTRKPATIPFFQVLARDCAASALAERLAAVSGGGGGGGGSNSSGIRGGFFLVDRGSGSGSGSHTQKAIIAVDASLESGGRGQVASSGGSTGGPDNGGASVGRGRSTGGPPGSPTGSPAGVPAATLAGGSVAVVGTGGEVGGGGGGSQGSRSSVNMQPCQGWWGVRSSMEPASVGEHGAPAGTEAGRSEVSRGPSDERHEHVEFVDPLLRSNL